MADTNMTESVSIPPIGASVLSGGASSSSVSYPTGTMIQHDGVDVSDDYDVLEVEFDVEESPNKTLNFGRTIEYQKNGVEINATEPSIVDCITNLDITESPSGTLEILDVDYQINNTPKQYGASILNFLGRKLLYDAGLGEVLFNACGDGYFGDGSDGDVVMDGETETTPIAIQNVLPVESYVNSTAQGTFTARIDFTIDIPMDVPFDSSDLATGSTNPYDPPPTIQLSAPMSQNHNILEILSDSSVRLNAGTDIGYVDEPLASVYVSRSIWLREIIYTNEQPMKILLGNSIPTGFVIGDSLRIYGVSFGGEGLYTDAQKGIGIWVTSNLETISGAYYCTLDGTVSAFTASILFDTPCRYSNLRFEKNSTSAGIFNSGTNYPSINIQMERAFSAGDVGRLIEIVIDGTTYTSEIMEYISPTSVGIGNGINPLVDGVITSARIIVNSLLDYSVDGTIPTQYKIDNSEAIYGLTIANQCVVIASAHGIVGNSKVLIRGIVGSTEANGIFDVVPLASNILILRGTTFTNTYTSGGTIKDFYDYTITKDMFYENLTIAETARLRSSGYRIFVRGILTLNGVIDNNGITSIGGIGAYFPSGSAGAVGGNGGGSYSAPYPGYRNGLNGQAAAAITNSAFSGITSFSGGGGNGSVRFPSEQYGIYGGTLGGAGSTATQIESETNFNNRATLTLGFVFKSDGTMSKIKGWPGGAGGGGGAGAGVTAVNNSGQRGGDGGEGGGAGGYVLVCAGMIIGSGKISSLGGNGSSGSNSAKVGAGTFLTGSGGGGGGGCGGSGGIVVVVYRHKFTEGITSVYGGSGGAGGIGQSITFMDGDNFVTLQGGTGFRGTVGQLGVIYEFRLT